MMVGGVVAVVVAVVAVVAADSHPEMSASQTRTACVWTGRVAGNNTWIGRRCKR